MTTPILELRNVTKRYGAQEVLSGFDLVVEDGEFFTLLGPSGCGKTTLLRLIAGFERPDEGQIRLRGQDISNWPAERRPVNTVFQSYALFPHLTVFENVAFGPRMAGVAGVELKQRVEEALRRVQLDDLAARKPGQLSGGQRQRVAIARAVINRPAVLLLDESLSALDRHLRQQMRVELKQLQRQLGITFLFVTHDQEEALSLSDRVLVMNHGVAQQTGAPREIYESPRNLFVARFIGEANCLPGTIEAEMAPDRYRARILGECFELVAEQRFSAGDAIHLVLRPEDLRVECIEDRPPERPGFVGVVVERHYTGRTLDSVIRLQNGALLRSSEFFDEDDPDFDYRIDQSVWVGWVSGWEHVVPADETG